MDARSDALREGAGVGRRLIEAVAEADRAQGARELVVMTANDNLRALRLYQRTGFRLYELRAGGVQVAGALIRRKAGPQITGTR